MMDNVEGLNDFSIVSRCGMVVWLPLAVFGIAVWAQEKQTACRGCWRLQDCYNGRKIKA